jgi:hypothetical protein
MTASRDWTVVDIRLWQGKTEACKRKDYLRQQSKSRDFRKLHKCKFSLQAPLKPCCMGLHNDSKEILHTADNGEDATLW